MNRKKHIIDMNHHFFVGLCATVTTLVVIVISSVNLWLPTSNLVPIWKVSELQRMWQPAQNSDLTRKPDTSMGQLSYHSPLSTAGSMAIPQPEAFSFVEYSPENWKIKKSIYKRQSLKQHGQITAKNGRSYFQYNWEPSFTCDFEERIGGMGDGGKWLCNAYKITKAEE